MTEPDLIGYALDLLDPADRAAVESHVAADPAAADRLTAVRRAVAPLAADRDPPAVPALLAARTLARVAEYVVATEPRADIADGDGQFADATGRAAVAGRKPSADVLAHDGPEPRQVGGRFRPDLVVAAGIGLLAFGLAVSGVAKVRSDSQVAACQNNLRGLHAALVGYSDRHDGRFPQVGGPRHETAGSFVAALADAGDVPSGFNPICPAAGHDQTPPQYTYSLGYRGPGDTLFGLRRAGDEPDGTDLMAISADCPAAGSSPAGGPVSPHARGQNVLYVGGHVRFATVSTVGLRGDDIYLNRDGLVAAGLDPTDAVLGRAGDRP